jgi:hypothetical protein
LRLKDQSDNTPMIDMADLERAARERLEADKRKH